MNITVAGVEYNQTTSPQVIIYQDVYQCTLTNGTTIDPSDLVTIYALNGTMTNTTSYTWDGVDLTPRQNITFTSATPDLEVDSISPNPPCASGGDYFLFGNESNDICAKIENTGGADAGAFNVSIEAGSFYQEVNVSRLNASENITVCVTDPTLRAAGVSVIINVTADCNGVVSPEISELNNASNVTEIVVNNGYKGKTYTGGSNITTEQTHVGLQGQLLYSVGDSYYQGSYYAVDEHWTTYTANWASCDFCSIPPAATIEKAKLYVYYNWDKQNVVPNHVSLTFNGNTETADAFYSDTKGYGSYASNAYHMQAYNVTANFTSCITNTAVLTNSYPGGGNVSIDGMLLVVIYDDATMQSQTIWLNEECDILMSKSYTCASPKEATAYANFTNVPVTPDQSAKLIAVAPSAKDGVDKNMLTFNNQEWNGAWDHFEGSTQIGIADVDIDTSTYPLVSESWATFNDTGDGFRATNAILLVSDAPYPRITTPSDGDSITGTVWVNETGPDDAVYNLFEYYYDEDCNCCKNDGNSWVLIGNDTDGTDGWGVQWDTAPLTPGCYIVRATMGDSDGFTGTDEICVNVGSPVIAVDPKRTLTQPQDQFDVNITFDPNGRGIFGVQYTLKYDNAVLKAESQVTRDFFGNNNTVVVISKIDQAKGEVTYSETLLNGSSEPCIKTKGTLTTIQFTAIGEPNSTSKLNFTDVIIVDCDKEKTDSGLENGTVHIFDNRPPEITCVNSTHEKNNAQKKFECWTQLCVNITDGGEKGYNISYIRWSFGDGQYGTAEGGLPCNPHNDTCCNCKNHSYISWIYNASCLTEMPRVDHNGDPHRVCYDPFNASVTVTDDGCIPEADTEFFDVWVFMTGDANGDSKVNILDAVWIGKHFNEKCDGPAAKGATHCAGNCGYMWSSNQKSGADLNNDCAINILDAVIVGTMWGHTAY